MVLVSGSTLLVCHRRLFPEDQPRFFVGTVTACEGGIAKATGFSWTRDATHGYRRKDDKRTKVVSVASGALIVYRLPVFVDIESLRIENGPHREVLLTDGQDFEMDLTDWRQSSK